MRDNSCRTALINDSYRTDFEMENPLLWLLFLAIVIMAGYFYFQRAKARGTSETADEHRPVE